MKVCSARREPCSRRARSASLLLACALALSACTSVPRPTPSSVAAAASVPTVPCSVDLDSAEVVVRLDYAGYAAKVLDREAAFAAATRTARMEARQSAEARGCTAAIQRWLDFFRDPHLMVWGSTAATLGPGPLHAGTGAQDGTRPSIRFPDDSTSVLRLPDFALRHAGAIDSLLSRHHGEIVSRPYLVVDVRRNGGGWDGSYARLSRLLYTGPVLVHGWDTWSSEGNIAAMRDGLAYEGLPETVAEAIRAVLPKMESNPGAFVALEENRELRLDTIFPLPRSVGVIIDRGCASSCELFVLEAAQSSKVVLMGRENTHGAVDYGHVRTVYLPSRTLALRVPIARSHRLDVTSLDLLGIAPQIRIPEGAGDAVEYAIQHLRGNGAVDRVPEGLSASVEPATF
jgi:hypothetical protein